MQAWGDFVSVCERAQKPPFYCFKPCIALQGFIFPRAYYIKKQKGIFFFCLFFIRFVRYFTPTNAIKPSPRPHTKYSDLYKHFKNILNLATPNNTSIFKFKKLFKFLQIKTKKIQMLFYFFSIFKNRNDRENTYCPNIGGILPKSDRLPRPQHAPKCQS